MDIKNAITKLTYRNYFRSKTFNSLFVLHINRQLGIKTKKDAKKKTRQNYTH